MKKTSRLRFATALVVLSFFLLTSIALAASVGIDTFDGGVQALTADSATPNVFDAVSGTMVGGERDIELNRDSGTGIANVYVDLDDSNKVDIANLSATRSTTTITWDGADGVAALDPSGLGSIDLTSGNTNQGLHFELTFDDKPVDIIFRYYSGSATAYDEYVLELPGGIDSTGHVDYYIPFATGWTSVGGGADVTQVGAFQLIVDASQIKSEAGDVSFDFFEADNFRDVGDLPTTFAYGVPTHISTGLRLGSNIDIEDPAEAAIWGSTNANGDDLDGFDDEDGVVQTPGFNWTGVNGGSIDVTVTGCSGTCYLSAWIDWVDNGTFTDGNVDGSGVNEQIFNDQSVTNGTTSLTFAVPPARVGAGSTSAFLARVRLCDSTGQCNTPGSAATSGEVEDYRWGFDPTAIRLSSLTARPSISSGLVVSLAGASFLVILALAIIFKRRRRQEIG